MEYYKAGIATMAIIGACVLAWNDKEGWGWLLLLAFCVAI